MKIFNYPTRIPGIYGAIIAICLIVYFFVCYLLGIAHITELRFINFIILLVSIYKSFKQYIRTHGRLEYFNGLITGVASAFVGASTFTLFIFFFLLLNDGFMQTLMQTAPLGEHLDPYIASFSVWFENIFMGFVATFILINYMETTKAPKPSI